MLRPKVRSLLARFAGDEGGNMVILFGAAMMLGAVLAAFAIDEAALYGERRAAQSGADLASLAAARDPANAFAHARLALVDAGLIGPDVPVSALQNPSSPHRLTVETGHYRRDPAMSASRRFQPGAFPINAVRVHYARSGTLYFASSFSPPPPIGVEAVSSVTPEVAFSLGSRLARLEDGVANAVLNSLLGTSISLSAASYNGLLNADVSAFAFLDALAQELHLSAGTYADVLAASADHGVIARALAQVLDGPEKSAALAIAAAAGGNGKVPMSKLFDLGAYVGMGRGNGAGGVFARLSALELLSASAALSDGSHQVALNLGAKVPGLLRIETRLVIGEPPGFASWFAIDRGGTVLRTAQIRLRFIAMLGGGPILLNAGVRLPLYLDAGFAEARVHSAACPAADSRTGTATILAQPGVARLILGEVSDSALANFSTPPPIGTTRLIDLLLLKVKAKARAEISQIAPVPLAFSVADIIDGRVRTARTSTLTQSLMVSLMQDLDLTVDVLGLGLASPSVIANAVISLLAPLTPVLDSTIDTVLELFGLSIGEADVRVYGVRCTQPVLVH